MEEDSFSILLFTLALRCFYRRVVKMAIEDMFNGAWNAFIYYFAYITMVAQEIGM
jgi:hypothetical protein